jgi:hypothetical protein
MFSGYLLDCLLYGTKSSVIEVARLRQVGLLVLP